MVNIVLTGVVKKINSTTVIVELENQYEGLLHISNVSDYYVNNLNYMFEIGKEYPFKIIELDDDKKRAKLDWKSIHPRFLKNPFKYEVKETKSGFENLLENTLKEVEND